MIIGTIRHATHTAVNPNPALKPHLQHILGLSKIIQQTISLSKEHRAFSTKTHPGLVMYRLRKSGREISFDDFLAHLSSTNQVLVGPQKLLASDSKGFVYERFPEFLIKKESPKIEIKKRPKPPTLLHFAIRNKDAAEIKRLIANGADVNARGVDGRTPLFDAVKTGSAEIVDLLLSHGARPHQYENSAWNYNISPFHYAIQLKFFKITQLFIEKWGIRADEPVLFYDYGWPPEPIDFVLPAGYDKRFTPFKRAESEKILLLLLNKLQNKFIRNRDDILENAKKYNMHKVVELMQSHERL